MRTLTVSIIMTLACVANAQTTTQPNKTLADHYAKQQQMYEQKAAEEKQEWIRRSQINSSLYAKYPRPADAAKNLYEYYTAKAEAAGKLKDKYSGK